MSDLCQCRELPGRKEAGEERLINLVTSRRLGVTLTEIKLQCPSLGKALQDPMKYFRNLFTWSYVLVKFAKVRYFSQKWLTSSLRCCIFLTRFPLFHTAPCAVWY